MTDTSEEISHDLNTYILVGDRINIGNTINNYHDASGTPYPTASDTHIIYFQKYPSIKDAIGQITKFPARIILECHGDKDGNFEWNQNEWINYIDLFRNLPHQGIDSILTTTCFGSIATEKKVLASVPAGSLLFTLSANGSIVFPTSSLIKRFKGNSSLCTSDPIDFFLDTLARYTPTEYVFGAEKNGESTEPLNAVPHMMGIGGKPPRQIDFDEIIIAIGERKYSRTEPINKIAWENAIRRVQSHFGVGFRGYNVVRRAADQRVQEIAKKIRGGESITASPSGISNAEAWYIANGITVAEDLRIAYALAAAYLDESGQIAKWQEEARRKAGFLSNSISTQMAAKKSPVTGPERLYRVNPSPRKL